MGRRHAHHPVDGDEPLAEADIVAFIESNSRYHGKTLHGRPIIAPAALKDHHEPVLISSRVFEKEIAEQVRDDLGCANELILLYNVAIRTVTVLTPCYNEAENVGALYKHVRAVFEPLEGSATSTSSSTTRRPTTRSRSCGRSRHATSTSR